MSEGRKRSGFDLGKVRDAALVAFLAFAAVVSYLALRGYHFEDAYITYRYAANLAAGDGFVFTPGERVLGTSNPFYTLLLAALAALLLALGLSAAGCGGSSEIPPFTIPDPTSDGRVVYYEHQFGELRRKDLHTGATVAIAPRNASDGSRLRKNWMTPFVVSHHDPSTLYYGAQVVLKSTNRGDDWTVIREAPLQKLDQAIDLGRQYGVHININFHRIPGYCINGRDLEPVDLYEDTPENMQKAMDGAIFH